MRLRLCIVAGDAFNAFSISVKNKKQQEYNI